MSSVVILVLHNLSRFEEVLAAWHDAGAPAVTIYDCVGTRDVREQARRDDLPLLPTIRDLLQSDDAPRKTILAVVPDEAVDAIVRATEKTVGDLRQPGNGILFVLPTTRVVGMR